MLPRVSVVSRAAYQSTGPLSPATNLGAKRVRARPPPTPLGSSQSLYPYVARDRMFIENGLAGGITRLQAAPAQKE